MLYNNSLFQKIRLLLVKELAQNKVIGHAVVSGQSITGMIAAAILAHSGYRVDVYDIRERYTRNIQWSARQSLIDELASIDPELSNRFLRHVGTPLYRGSIHLKPNGIRKYSKHNGPKLGNPVKIPLNSTEMVNNPSVVNMEAKVFEKMLKEYLKTLPRVQHHIGSINLKRCHNKNYYCIVQNNKQDIIPNIIIIAEG
ncbi:FAD/NAD(P)-binding protein [Candidatus Tisiphia endosymbiont of Thecophora atra]|uniref:FAD/NAD(P)-binding protein n=1 Tax=Candidatus Tisiphia endosymbiont of Thecophora atra TaxID=3066258 RepID=UPI00312C9F17